MYQYPNAAVGIRKILVSQIISIIGMVVTVIPMIGAAGVILMIAGLILYKKGLRRAGRDVKDYRNADMLVNVNIVIAIVGVFASRNPVTGGVFGILLNAGSSLINLLILDIVISTTCGILRNVGSDKLAATGQGIWKTYLICTVISIISNLLSLLPLSKFIPGVVALIISLLLMITMIVMIVAMIRYLLFLSNSAYALDAD